MAYLAEPEIHYPLSPLVQLAKVHDLSSNCWVDIYHEPGARIVVLVVAVGLYGQDVRERLNRGGGGHRKTVHTGRNPVGENFITLSCK